MARPDHWNRWHRASRPSALAALALLLALMLYGVTGLVSGGGQTEVTAASKMRAQGMSGDHALYANVASRVEAGEPYYAAAAAEHRANNYPLRPFITVRLPTLAYIFGLLGKTGGHLFVAAIGILAILAWWRRLTEEPELPIYARFGALLILANMSQVLLIEWVLIHEVAAGALIALGLALYRPERPILSFAGGATLAALLAAALIRETALPVAMILGCFALVDRDRRATAAWLSLGLIVTLVLALHWQAVSDLLRTGDQRSPGWNSMGGWPAYLAFVHNVSVFRFLPGWVSAFIVPLGLLGWATWRSRLAVAVFAVQLTLAVLMMLFARPSNFYWAMLVVPTLHIGLIFTPAALAELLSSVFVKWASVKPNSDSATPGASASRACQSN